MTALRLLADLRRRGVLLTRSGDRMTFDAPAGVMTAELRAKLVNRRAELLAILAGEYARAAMLLLLLRETEPGERRDGLVLLFDERLAICEIDGGLDYGEACRTAYRELARMMEGGGR